MLSRADIRNGGLDRWRRKSPATILFAILLTLGQMQSALAAITNSAIANGTYAAAPIVSLNSDVSVPVTPAASALTMTKTAVSASYDQIGDVISYTLEVANSGTGTVTAITVSDPGAGSVVCPVSGNATIASLAPGASETCTATHAVIAADMTAGTYVNTASATGTGPGGSAPSGNDTATVNRIDADLQTVKTLASGNSGPQVGDVVAYNVTVTNAGPADATNVSLTDLLPAGLTATAGNGVVTGGTYVPATGLWTIGLLASGASVTLALEGTVNNAANGTVITNIATAAVADQVDPSTATDDLTETVTVGQLSIAAADDDFTASPVPSTGGATPTVYVNDTLNGAPFAPAAVTPSIVADGGLTGVIINADGTLSVPAGMAAGSYPVTYSICEVLNPANCDEAVATVVVGTGTITALDDDFTASPVPSTGGATPTVYVNDTLNGAPFAPAAVTPSIVADGGLTGVSINADGTLSVPAGLAAGSYPVTYSICEVLNPANCDEAVATVVVESPATATLAGFVFEDANGNGAFDPGSDPVFGGYGVSILDPSGAVVGTAITNPDGSYSVANLVPGVEYRIVFANPGGTVVGGISNIVLAAGENLQDQNLPLDPSGVIYDAVTRLPIAGATVVMADAAGTPLPAVCFVNPAQQSQVTGVDGGYRFDLIPGADPACPVGETAYQLLVTSPAGYQNGPSTLLPPMAGPVDVTACTFDAVPGGACQTSASVNPPVSPAPAVYVLSVLLEAGDPDLIHNHIPLDPIAAPGGQVTLTKAAARKLVRYGESVTYTITAVNSAASSAGLVTIADRMPAGFRFVEGSATINGVAAAPIANGQLLTFGPLPLAAGATVEVQLTLEVLTSAGTGIHTNRANILNALGVALAAEASAAVEIKADPVFDCTDIIGKVFDDKNRNGIQDAESSPYLPEPGLAGVRLATVRGTLITTDKYGRFHVPCADVPDDATGANFILKLDARTLPTGYRLTTENPKVVRLTPGKIAKINFGAAIGRVVRLDLNGEAFAAGSTVLNAKWREGMDDLVRILLDEQSTLRITYQAAKGEGDLAKRRVSAAVKLVKEIWADKGGRYRLEIETEIVKR